jgi:hypothetical protein
MSSRLYTKVSVDICGGWAAAPEMELAAQKPKKLGCSKTKIKVPKIGLQTWGRGRIIHTQKE